MKHIDDENDFISIEESEERINWILIVLSFIISIFVVLNLAKLIQLKNNQKDPLIIDPYLGTNEKTCKNAQCTALPAPNNSHLMPH